MTLPAARCGAPYLSLCCSAGTSEANPGVDQYGGAEQRFMEDTRATPAGDPKGTQILGDDADDARYLCQAIILS